MAVYIGLAKQMITRQFILELRVLRINPLPYFVKAAPSHCLPLVTVMKNGVKKHLLTSILMFLWMYLLQYTTEMIKGQKHNI